jgi:hypothetical protein
MRTTILTGLTAGWLLLAATARDARACGGCFPPSQNGTVVTDHRMIFAVSPQQTTLYDQIRYQGAPSSFAWVLPIHGPVTVGLSSDTLFAALDQVTQTTIVAPPRQPCPPPPSCPCCGVCGVDGSAADPAAIFGGVSVISQAVVGPYETVQLQSTDPMALSTWLAANSYVVPPAVQPMIAAYVKEGFDFLAMRLVPGAGVQAMRPVSVTSPGAGLSLPLRMVAAGTGATVGITLWVVATGRYEPQNFQTFTVSGSELTWDWSKQLSDYTTIRAKKEAALGNAAWQIESSLDTSPYQVENLVLGGPAADSYGSASASAAGDAATPDELRQQDLATIFPASPSGTVRITRLRADLSQTALASDLVLQAAADQSTLTNVYQAANSVNLPVCPTYPPLHCPVCRADGSGGGASGHPAPPIESGDGGANGPINEAGGAGDESGGTPSESAGGGGCATSPVESGGAGIELAIPGLLAISLLRARARRR